MNLFGKKKDEKEMVKEQSGCCCGGNCNEESVEAAKETLSSGANVKVLGGGCDKCNAFVGDFYMHDYFELPYEEEINLSYKCFNCMQKEY